MPSKPERHRDRRGIAFDERHLLVPTLTANWPPYPNRVKDDKAGLQRDFHCEFGGRSCWLCGDSSRGANHQLHHLFAGSRGRSHERELFTWLCRSCHDGITAAALPWLLYAKWKCDNEWCDWELMTIRHGRHLPELKIPDWLA